MHQTCYWIVNVRKRMHNSIPQFQFNGLINTYLRPNLNTGLDSVIKRNLFVITVSRFYVWEYQLITWNLISWFPGYTLGALFNDMPDKRCKWSHYVRIIKDGLATKRIYLNSEAYKTTGEMLNQAFRHNCRFWLLCPSYDTHWSLVNYSSIYKKVSAGNFS